MLRVKRVPFCQERAGWTAGGSDILKGKDISYSPLTF